MRKFFFITILLLSLKSIAQTKILPAEIQVKTALLAAPEEQRPGAMVYGYDDAGELVVLKEGSNNLICLADDPEFKGIKVVCYAKKLEPFMSRGRELTAEGKPEIEKRKIRKEEVETGKLKMPDTPSAMFVFSGSSEEYDQSTGELKNGKFRYVVYIPYATAESTGLPLKPDNPGMPWLMDPGTHRAHIMISPTSN